MFDCVDAFFTQRKPSRNTAWQFAAYNKHSWHTFSVCFVCVFGHTTIRSHLFEIFSIFCEKKRRDLFTASSEFIVDWLILNLLIKPGIGRRPPGVFRYHNNFAPFCSIGEGISQAKLVWHLSTLTQMKWNLISNWKVIHFHNYLQVETSWKDLNSFAFFVPKFFVSKILRWKMKLRTKRTVL